MHTETSKSKKRFGVKALVLTSALTIAANAAIGGTIAWLISKTDPVENTFTYGDINITLTETDTGDNDGDAATNTYEMVPGTTITKDPEITVEADSEDCWLFVQLNKSANFDTFMDYTLADGWSELEGEAGVYYRAVDGEAEEQTFGVLLDNAVTVKEDVTKGQLNALDADGAKNYPTLTVMAYAVQRSADLEAIDTAAEAWALAQN